MEKQEERRQILKPLKNKNNHNLIFFIYTWYEFLIILLLLIIIISIANFMSAKLTFKWMLDASLILLLLSFLIKIHKKNIYHQISLLMKFQILKKNYSNKKMIDSIKYEIKDQNLIWNNTNFYAKRISFKCLDNDFEHYLNLSQFVNETNEIYLIITNKNNLLNEYTNKLNTIQNNKLENFLNNHKEISANINETTYEKEIYVIYRNENDLNLINLNLFEIHEINKSELQKIQNKLNLIQYNKQNTYKRRWFKQNESFYAILNFKRIKKMNHIGWLNKLINLNIEDHFIVNLTNLIKTQAVDYLNKEYQITFFSNKTKNEEVKQYNDLINDYKQRIISEHETLFKINFYLVVSANSKEELYEKNNAYKSFFKSDLIELKEVNYDYFFINLFEQYKNINKSNLSNIYLTNTQLTLGWINHEQTVKKYNGILLGKDFHDQALFLNQDEYLTRNNNDINGINLILAKSGAGKSILLKKIIYLSSLIKKQKIIILDVENEYSFLVKSFHNSLMIDLLPLELDPFKLEFNTNNEKIIFLASFLNCLCNHDFTNELSQYFKKVNIHGFWFFVKWLKNNHFEKYQYIKEIDNEIYNNWFTKSWIINEHELIIFNFKKIFDEEFITNLNFINASLILVFSIISKTIFNNKNDVYNLIIDEAHKFFNIQNKLINNIWYSIIKKSRKYQTLLTFATQNFNDLYVNDFANKILGNLQYLFIGKLNDLDLNYLMQYLNINNFEKEKFKKQIISLKQTEFLYSNNNKSFVKWSNWIDDDILKKYYLNPIR